MLDREDMALPPIRGDLRDIFDGDGPPIPSELRNRHPVTMTGRPGQGSHHEDMLVRRLQGQWDAYTARHLQYPGNLHDEREILGGVGQVYGIGNAAGHLMNEDYRGDGRYRVPTRAVTLDRGVGYVGDEGRARNKRADSMEQRLADRLSETRPETGIRARMGPVASSRAPPTTHGPEPQRRTLRQHGPQEELHSRRPRTARSERVVGARLSRTYEDESDAHAPASRRRELEDRPRSSDMAGLNGRGQGMNRVSQWMAQLCRARHSGWGVDREPRLAPVVV